jgi:hypothetical protein
MKISVRTDKNGGSVLALFQALLALPGDQLFLTSGYMSSPWQLPAASIARSVGSIVVAVGHWPNVSVSEAQRALDDMFAHIQKGAASAGVPPPAMRSFIGFKWHGKVALKRNSADGSVTGAIIGSSNVSMTAMRPGATAPNHEVDIFVTAQDGKDAAAELLQLYDEMKWPLKGKGYKLPHIPSASPAPMSKSVTAAASKGTAAAPAASTAATASAPVAAPSSPPAAPARKLAFPRKTAAPPASAPPANAATPAPGRVAMKAPPWPKKSSGSPASSSRAASSALPASTPAATQGVSPPAPAKNLAFPRKTAGAPAVAPPALVAAATPTPVVKKAPPWPKKSST